MFNSLENSACMHEKSVSENMNTSYTVEGKVTQREKSYHNKLCELKVE